MARTITQIAGEFGLQRGATADPFQQQEQAVLENVQRSLEDIRSQQQEEQAARGFGRSTFSEGIMARQTADVLGQVGQQFAQARTAEALQETALERDIIRQQTQADVSSRLLGEQTEAEVGLIGARGAEQRATEAAGVEARTAGEQALIGARGEEQRLTLAEQIAGQAQLSTQEAQQQLEKLQAQTTAEADLIGARGEQQRLGIQESAAAQQQLTQLQGIEERLTQAQSFEEQTQLVDQKALIQTQQLEQSYLNDLNLLNAKYDRIIAQLPEELRLKAEYEKEVFRDQLQVTREQEIVDFVTEAAFTKLLNLFSDGFTEGLPDLNL